MGEIVQFEPRKEPEPVEERDLIWQCNCGCQTFYLSVSGEPVCANCEEAFSAEGEWFQRLPQPSPDDDDIPTVGSGDEKSVILVGFGDQNAGFDTVLGRASPEDTAAIVIMQNTGAVHVWGDVEGEAQQEWLLRQLETAREVLLGE